MPNGIDAVYPDGRKAILFKPPEPYETADAIEEICDEYAKAIIKKEGVAGLPFTT